MVEIETCDDIADEMADKLGIYGEDRSFFVGDLSVRMREAVKNEKKLWGHK
uniref:Uncharacterized protein n=1 Tax=viral metagenome TaxID=1070528 RepID=A0A6M3M984_9ZZZZ